MLFMILQLIIGIIWLKKMKKNYKIRIKIRIWILNNSNSLSRMQIIIMLRANKYRIIKNKKFNNLRIINKIKNKIIKINKLQITLTAIIIINRRFKMKTITVIII
jgi:hypothetical protein